MPRLHPFLLLVACFATVGWGCAVTPYTPALETAPVVVSPSQEGGRASTGGVSTTVTPSLSTAQLVAALPSNGSGWRGGEVAELRNPIPLPDGTRTEYTGVTREYTNATGESIRLTITDTRGIPALTAFLEGYDTRQTDAAYRSRIPLGNEEGWMTYAYGTQGEADGTGSLALLVRERFLIQLDGSMGVSAEAIAALAEQIQFKQFN